MAKQLHKSSPTVTQAVETTFSLKKGFRPSNFITEVNLKSFKLPSSESPQTTSSANPFMVVLSPTTNAFLKVVADSAGGFGVV